MSAVYQKGCRKDSLDHRKKGQSTSVRITGGKDKALPGPKFSGARAGGGDLKPVADFPVLFQDWVPGRGTGLVLGAWVFFSACWLSFQSGPRMVLV